MKVEIKRDICIGAATCSAIAPDVFELDDDMKAVIKRNDGSPSSDLTDYQDLETPTDDEVILEAAKSCPTLAIFIYDDADKQIFPPPASS